MGEPLWAGPWLAPIETLPMEEGLCPACLAERAAQAALVSALQQRDPGPPPPWAFCTTHAETCRRSGLTMTAAPETVAARRTRLAGLQAALEATEAGHSVGQLARARAVVGPPEPCPLCEVTRWAAARAIARCSPLLEEQGGAGSLIARSLCIRHLPEVLATTSPAAIERVCCEQEARLVNLLAQIAEYFRKVDYRYAHEPKGSEQGAWLQGIAHMAGLPSWPQEIPAEVKDG